VAKRSVARRRRPPKTIDEYIARSAPQAQPILRRVRATIAKAAPDATETISYGMPAFKLRRIVFYFAAFKRHIGLYPPVNKLTTPISRTNRKADDDARTSDPFLTA
jgi:uncharacterized protein YdhG (YjbR/CyaY superfamily)